MFLFSLKNAKKEIRYLYVQTLVGIFCIISGLSSVFLHLVSWDRACITVFVVLLLITFFFVHIEKFFIHFHGAKPLQSPSIAPILMQVHQNTFPHSIIPKLFICSDPLPYIFWARGLGQPGIIVISQGFFFSLNSIEFIDVLKFSLFKLKQPGIFLNTLYSLFLLLCLKCNSPGWIQFIFSKEGIPFYPKSLHSFEKISKKYFHPLKTFQFLIFLPWIHLCLKIQKKIDAIDAALYTDKWGYNFALEKLARFTLFKKRTRI